MQMFFLIFLIFITIDLKKLPCSLKNKIIFISIIIFTRKPNTKSLIILLCQ